MGLAYNSRFHALVTYLRKRRFSFFRALVGPVPRPIRILDIGGTQYFWEKMEFVEEDVTITLLNFDPKEVQVTYKNLSGVLGDARDMRQFRDNEFDVAFSNSVIEHVGNYEDQRKMANEVRRVAKRYFVETPNRYFPIEPHFIFPFFQFLPRAIRAWLLSHFNLGTWDRARSKQEAFEGIDSVRLLSRRELKELFPGARIFEEKLLGLTKSFAVYDGWEAASRASQER